MATKEKIKKKKKTQPSPATKRKPKSASKHHDNEAFDDDIEAVETLVGTTEDMQGSQLSVRSASVDNIQDNTAQDDDMTGTKDDNGAGIPTPQQSSTGPQTSVSEGKKTKKDHVDKKLGKGKEKKEKKRAPSPEQKPEKPMGSAVSLRSNVSRASREAWIERKEEDVKDKKKSSVTKVESLLEVASSQGPSGVLVKGSVGNKGPFRLVKDNKVFPTDNNPSTSSINGDVVTLKESAVVKREDGLKGVKVEVVEDCPEKHAYIPYLYARNCIAKISQDMAAMKTKHIIIVESIQEHYGIIESETQEQFNMFVLCMREEYSSKRHAFRQVIDTHKVELDKKEKYWNEMLTSLAERNNRLLKEKKMLLVHSKTEIERLEKEKDELEKQYAEREPPKPAVVPGAWEDERKVLQDQLENEKATSASLREQLANQQPEIQAVETTSHVKSEVKTEGGKESAEYKPGALATASVMLTTKEVNEQMEKERKQMAAERAGLTDERAKFDEEREGFAIERRKWMDKITELETDLATKTVSSEKWHAKHDDIKGRLEEAANYQARFMELEGQYAALAALVNNSNTDDALKAELAKVEQERAMMTEEKMKLDKDIAQWEKDFEKKNKRKPTDDDKPDSVQEMYTTRGEVSYMVDSLQTKENTYREVEKGRAPDPPEISHIPIDTRDPKVVTVKVEVRDPTVVEELEKCQSDLVLAQSEGTQLKQEITDLRAEISEQNQHLATQRQRVAELEHEVARLKAEGVAGGLTGTVTGGANVSEEELETLKKENRELRRDMKKMIKQYERLAAMKQADGTSTGGTAGGGEDTAEALGELDNKIADLEAENEALKEERANLREKVKMITETITVTHFEENKKTVDEKDKKIDDLLQELTKLREENVSMAKDMKKMVKTHMKTKARLDELASIEKAAKLLEIVAMLVHEIHSTVPDAANQVNDRLNASVQEVGESKEALDEKQALYQKWLDKYQKQHGKTPGKGDRDAEGSRIHGDWEEAKAFFQDRHLHMSALQLMKTGDISAAVGKDDSSDNRAEIEIASLEKALAVADNRMIDLEAANRNTEADRDRYKDKVEDLENMVRDMQKQLKLSQTLMADSQSTAEMTEQLSELQRKSDSFESELMQERMSHVSTRDELETLRKQVETVREELENERSGADARIQAAKLGLEQQLGVKDEELNTLKAKNDQLEKDKLSKLPPDAAAEVKALQDQLKQLEADKSGSKSSSAALTAQLAELNSKLETANKNLETTRAANRELEAKVKAGRSEKDREAKKISRHMEEKQQKAFSEDKQRIALLVKRVKELEAHAGKSHAPVPVPVGGGGGHTSDAEVAKLKREIKDQEGQIKRLEKELRLGGGGLSAKEAVQEKSKMAKAEKVLKDLEKKLDHEKEKSNQIMEGLKAADDENKSLKKDLDEQHRVNIRLGAELKTIGAAAKEGIEAAAKVKELEGDNKRLSEENVTLTKNFESERVLRKKYYNMVEDMKGKIRVYCRARPMSKSELDRGNKAVLNSADEYSVSVETNRGLKEFQYDQVFMEDSTQEKIFEDTNNLIQSAMDGYNVCIFAYGQTGSGKTFTMIGDRDQKFPGIAPRAFNRIFEMIDEMKSKFTVKVETYMLELYNEKLIDLFAKPGGGTDDEKLDIKKDKKGMVFIQGSVIKSARNSKELFALFEEGSMNRHVASTKMNAESSRSHLIIGITMESTNKNTGNVTKGKLSLVDLAGSERVAKTQAGADQLKEAMSINKSLSALGDVISALSSDQQFIPYRNNKLTMVMQDSLGGNAKTLMFVNISPADYNMDETVISLTYASRVKLITNDASKNADNKEIARLKNVISMLKKGENVDIEDDM